MPTWSTLYNKALRLALRFEEEELTTIDVHEAFAIVEKLVIQTPFEDQLRIFADLRIPLGKIVDQFGNDATLSDVLLSVLVDKLTSAVMKALDEPDPPDSVIYPSRRIPRSL